RGISRGHAGKTVYSNKGCWALSHTFAVGLAYPNRYFIKELGLKIRSDEKHAHWFRPEEMDKGNMRSRVRARTHGSVGGRGEIILLLPPPTRCVAEQPRSRLRHLDGTRRNPRDF
ncbi:hypothetical protein QUF80_03340, partial [Desulfococcaceae bacterium HSG8]|nr:hypothetical protein [Desulfococcaceae bacterium HSG8]